MEYKNNQQKIFYTIKKIAKLSIPPILLSLFKHMKEKRVNIESLPIIQRNNKKIIVLGNGPTLNESYKLYKDKILIEDCMVVNHIAISEIYEEIKPLYYVMADPHFFKKESELDYTVRNTVQAIINKTSWEMIMIFPKTARNSYISKALSNKINISILYYDNTNFVVPNGCSLNLALDKNFICPPSQTVLNTCIWASLYWGYKETYLIGADTSFVEDERIDQTTNELYSLDTHFYSTDEENRKKRRIIPTKFHEELFSVATALKSYWDLKEYADWKGLKVYNASEYSWIDAFERKKLS